MSERTYSEIRNDFRQHIGANEIVATDTEDVYAIEAEIDKRFADRLDAAHKRELDAKDSVIQSLRALPRRRQRRRQRATQTASAMQLPTTRQSRPSRPTRRSCARRRR